MGWLWSFVSHPLVLAVVAIHAFVLLVWWRPIVLFVHRQRMTQFAYGRTRSVLQPWLSHVTDPWDAHEIVPGVLLGNLASACNLQRMRAAGVTHVLSVMTGASPPFPQHFGYSVVQVRDIPEEDLLAHLPEATEFVSAALAGGGRVFVHCAAGVSRSATVVAAHLVRSHNLSHVEAVEHVRKRRGVIRPNPGFLRQLEAWEARCRKDAGVRNGDDEKHSKQDL